VKRQGLNYMCVCLRVPFGVVFIKSRISRHNLFVLSRLEMRENVEAVV